MVAQDNFIISRMFDYTDLVKLPVPKEHNNMRLEELAL